MTEQEYIERRLDDQIRWYSKRSGQSQKTFKSLRLVEIVIATSLPFMISHVTETTQLLKLGTGALGVVVAAIAAILSLYKFQERWIQYRMVSERLKHHKFRFLTSVAPYDGPDAFQQLVINAENVMAQENAEWAQYMKAGGKDAKK